MRKSLYLYRAAHAKLSAQEFPPEYFYNHFRMRIENRINGSELIIKELGEEVGLPPCLMARFILKSFVHLYPLDSVNEIASSSVTVLEEVEESVDNGQGSAAQNKNSLKVATARITRILRDPDQIRSIDPILSDNLHYCLHNDFLTSPLTDQFRQQIGVEKEDYMHQRLREMGILFHSEAAMRAAGYPKTPDALLAYPVEIDGHIVNWIESKALFSDGPTHQTYLRDQYWPYYNRFGPGLVIYWFGFLEEINNDRDKEKGIVVMDRFPAVINKIKF